MKKRRQHRHQFLFEVTTAAGKTMMVSARAKVRTPTVDSFQMVVDEKPVMRSMKLHGAGNSSTCTVSCDLAENADKIPHPYVGISDFFRSTCFIASKLDADGRPSECYRWMHDGAWVQKLNDAKGGQKKLLEKIRAEGPIVITFRRRARKDRTKEGGTGKRDASRSTRLSGVTRLVGAKLRHADATLGWSPAMVTQPIQHQHT